jgi:hypothetical protein
LVGTETSISFGASSTASLFPDPTAARSAERIGLAPTPPAGKQAVFQVGGQGTLGLNLENAGLASLATAEDVPVPEDPWSPDGIDLLAGARGIYTCDACGSVSQLQDAAARRTAWQQPLSVANDMPPRTNPYH